MKRRATLTSVESATLRFVTRYIARYGIAPSIYDAGKALGVVPTTASSRFKRLVAKGYLFARPHHRRDVRLSPIR